MRIARRAVFRESAAAPLVAGNRVTLLVDGPQTLKAIRAAIDSARHHVHLETYIFADDEIGRALRELLIHRRQDGIEVRVLYDAIGSVTTPAAFFEPMRQAGVEVLQFQPLNPARTLPWKINNRDHRKIVVVDGRVAFTGGINISGATRTCRWRQRYAMLHAKTMVIDTALSMVGSANFDIRSFLHNNEVNAVIVGSEFAERMEALFDRDLRDTRELQLTAWRKRPWLDRFKEFSSSLFSYWL